MMVSRSRSMAWPVAVLLAIASVTFGVAAHAQVDVDVEVTGTAVPGGVMMATATVDITDGSVLQGYAWSQSGGVETTLSGATTATVTATLGSVAAYKAYLVHVIAEPPITAAQLPPNVPVPPEEFPAGLQDRFEVVGINPFQLEHAGLVVLEVEVTTSSGTYHGEAEIETHLPWPVTTGLRTVPVGLPVLLQGKEQDSYDWTLDGPASSQATLLEAASRNPYFTPDVAGTYWAMVTDEGTGMPAYVEIHAGTWRGVIVGQDMDGLPISDPMCTGCHSDGFAPDKFTPWRTTGHAEIFEDNLNTSTHYSSSCFSCHTVGFDTAATNLGFDEAADYQAFLGAGLLNVPGDNWTTVLDEFPATAKLANIQCENCHGPQNENNAHGPSAPEGEPRVTLSSNVCGSCHGEPARHGRFQQWQTSPHANYELAVDEGTSGNCARCHTGNGFLEWLPILLDDNPTTDPLADVEVTWTEDEIHPQTCQTCHDPHAIGTTSGNAPDATVRISGDTPLLIAGFQATDVGRGAICMTCHNSRRGLRNDNVFPGIVGTSEASRAPHPGPQADVLMGQNAYFVEVGQRANHSKIANVADTCVTCHMESTPPPAVLSYNQGGTNHTFYASPEICSDCHEASLTADLVAGAIDATMDKLEGLIIETLLHVMDEQIADGNSIRIDDVVVTDTSTIADVAFGESHGRQAITVTFNDQTVVGPVSMNSVDVVPPVGSAFDIYDVAPTKLVKAGWNWNLIHNDGSHGIHNPNFAAQVLDASVAAMEADELPCITDADTMCLNNDRFRVEVTWRDYDNTVGSGRVAPLTSDDAGVFWFFDADNWEMLVKVLDACDAEDFNSFWVFFAATTDVQFTLTVTDTKRGVQKMYTNELGHPANAVTDTAAFPTCP